MALRKFVAVLLSAVALTFGAPVVGIAQSKAPSTSVVRGQVVDAGGRGATGLSVELVREGFAVATTVSGPDGHFSFAGVPAANYVVRTMVNGRPSGVRVAVVAGEATQTALLVLPSVATASPAVVAIIGVNGILTTVTVALSVIAGEVVVEVQKSNDEETLFETRAEAQAFVTAQVVEQLGLAANNPVAATIINQIVNNIPVGPVENPQLQTALLGSGTL